MDAKYNKPPGIDRTDTFIFLPPRLSQQELVDKEVKAIHNAIIALMIAHSNLLDMRLPEPTKTGDKPLVVEMRNIAGELYSMGISFDTLSDKITLGGVR